jgi:uncharacterized phosphosugar-binding protein
MQINVGLDRLLHLAALIVASACVAMALIRVFGMGHLSAWASAVTLVVQGPALAQRLLGESQKARESSRRERDAIEAQQQKRAQAKSRRQEARRAVK